MLLLEVPNVFFDIADMVPNLESSPSKLKKCRSGSWSSLECPRNGGFNRHSFRHRPHPMCTPNVAGKPHCLKKQGAAASSVQTPFEQTKPTTTIVKSDRFSVNFDLKPFEPTEIHVKMDGNTLLVTGKRETNSEDQYELQEHINKVIVPDNVLIEQMKCSLTESGYLQIEAPFKPQEKEKDSGRIIPIEVIQKPDIEDIALD